MEILVEAIAVLADTAFVCRLAEHIAMAFVPRGIGDLRDDSFDMPSRGVEAVIKAHWVEVKPGITQVGE